MGASDEAARVIRNLVSIVGGLVFLVFVGLCGYLFYSCNEAMNPPPEDKGGFRK
jgi:hypothetical protein